MRGRAVERARARTCVRLRACAGSSEYPREDRALSVHLGGPQAHLQLLHLRARVSKFALLQLVRTGANGPVRCGEQGDSLRARAGAAASSTAVFKEAVGAPRSAGRTWARRRAPGVASRRRFTCHEAASRKMAVHRGCPDVKPGRCAVHGGTGNYAQRHRKRTGADLRTKLLRLFACSGGHGLG